MSASASASLAHSHAALQQTDPCAAAAASHAALSVSNTLLVLLSQHAFNLPLLQAMRVIGSCIEALPQCSADVQHVVLKVWFLSLLSRLLGLNCWCLLFH